MGTSEGAKKAWKTIRRRYGVGAARIMGLKAYITRESNERKEKRKKAAIKGWEKIRKSGGKNIGFINFFQ